MSVMAPSASLTPRGRRRDSLSIGEARRIALAAQGFDRPRPTTVNAGHLRRVIRQVGLLQIDSVSVLLPAHYQVPFSRLGPYDRARLDALIYRDREFTEQWAHEASILPVEHWPLIRHHLGPHERRWGALATIMAANADYAARVLDEVRARGPVVAGEIAEPNGARARGGGWWGWTMAKTTLEGHFARGAIAIAERRSAGFARAYDLAERVVPNDHHTRTLTREEAQRELVRLAARANGIATARDIADYYRMAPREARQRVAELASAGELHEVRVEGWREVAYLHPDARAPRSIRAAALLSPFDPVIWFRPRAERLFHFDYRIEIYVPKEKRKYGYYVLPFLLGDRLVARVDLKADRAAGSLRVLGAFVEAHARADDVAPPLARELRTMARWLELGDVSVAKRGSFARALSAAIRSEV
jgi:uncharacterized protein YcaQ